jgi:hypothetical protein
MRQIAILSLMFLAAFVSSFAQDSQLPKRKPIVDIGGGTIIGTATILPKPVFPPSGCRCRLSKSNKVVVEFIVDKKGSVKSAKAIKGHPFLRAISEATIRNSKFSASIVDYERVEAFGVITYEFVVSKNKWQNRVVAYKLKLNRKE